MNISPIMLSCLAYVAFIFVIFKILLPFFIESVSNILHANRQNIFIILQEMF